MFSKIIAGNGSKLETSFDEKYLIEIETTVHKRSRMDENFDASRALLESKGITIEAAMAKLEHIKQTD